MDQATDQYTNKVNNTNNDLNQIRKGEDPAPPVPREPYVPTLVGGGGDLASHVKEFHQSANIK